MCFKWYPQEHWMGSVTPVVNHSVCLKPATSESVLWAQGPAAVLLGPSKGSWQIMRAIGVEFIAPFVFALGRQVLGRRSFAVSGSLRGDFLGEGWVNRVTTGRSSALMKSCSCHLEKCTKSRSHHLKNSRTMRNAQPWAWCFIWQRELLVWNLVRWLL